MVSAEITNKKNTLIFGAVLQSGKTYIYIYNIHIIYIYVFTYYTCIHFIYIYIYLFIWLLWRGKKGAPNPKGVFENCANTKNCIFRINLGEPGIQKDRDTWQGDCVALLEIASGASICFVPFPVPCIVTPGKPRRKGADRLEHECVGMKAGEGWSAPSYSLQSFGVIA